MDVEYLFNGKKLREFYNSIREATKFGSEMHNYFTEIRKQKLSVGDLPEKFNLLESKLNDLNNFQEFLASMSMIFTKNPFVSLPNAHYAFMHNAN